MVSWRGLVDTMTLPGIGQLVLLGFLSILAFAALEGTLSPLPPAADGLGCRLGGVRVRGPRADHRDRPGGPDPPARPEVRRAPADRRGALTVALGFAAMALVSNVLELAGAIILVGVGQGLLGPSLSGLLSRITPMSEQGAVFGTLSSAQTLARMISYSVANVLLGRVAISAPYWFGFAIYLVTLLAAVRFLAHLSTYVSSGKLVAAGGHGGVPASAPRQA